MDIQYWDRETGENVERVTSDYAVPHKDDVVVIRGVSWLVRGRQIDYDDAVIEIALDRLTGG
jgi:hypothetical protein